MSIKIFVNLPVKDLQQSMQFYTAVGFKNNPQFTDETAACMVISEDIYIMLLTHKKFAEFTDKKIADATSSTEVINCISQDSKPQVDEMVKRALSAGGTQAKQPFDLGFMYSSSFNDPDGHIWEVMWMDPAAVNPA